MIKEKTIGSLEKPHSRDIEDTGGVDDNTAPKRITTRSPINLTTKSALKSGRETEIVDAVQDAGKQLKDTNSVRSKDKLTAATIVPSLTNKRNTCTEVSNPTDNGLSKGHKAQRESFTVGIVLPRSHSPTFLQHVVADDNNSGQLEKCTKKLRNSTTGKADDYPPQTLRDSRDKRRRIYDGHKTESRKAGFATIRSQSLRMFCKEGQQLPKPVHGGPEFVRYDEGQSKSTSALYRYFIPTSFNPMIQKSSGGSITNCHVISKQYIHGLVDTNQKDVKSDVISSTLKEYLESRTFKLIELKKFSSSASKRTTKKKKSDKSYFPEQVATRKRGIIVLKCAMAKSKITNTFHLFVLNLFANHFYEGGPYLTIFDGEDISNLKSLKKMFLQELGIKRVYSAFLVVHKDPKIVAQKDLKEIDYDNLYGPVVDKRLFPKYLA